MWIFANNLNKRSAVRAYGAKLNGKTLLLKIFSDWSFFKKTCLFQSLSLEYSIINRINNNKQPVTDCTEEGNYFLKSIRVIGMI